MFVLQSMMLNQFSFDLKVFSSYGSLRREVTQQDFIEHSGLTDTGNQKSKQGKLSSARDNNGWIQRWGKRWKRQEGRNPIWSTLCGSEGEIYTCWLLLVPTVKGDEANRGTGKGSRSWSQLFFEAMLTCEEKIKEKQIRNKMNRRQFFLPFFTLLSSVSNRHWHGSIDWEVQFQSQSTSISEQSIQDGLEAERQWVTD